MLQLAEETKMRIDTRRTSDVTILDLHSKLMITDGGLDLQKKVQELLDAGEKKILLNVQNVRQVDSFGVGQLVMCYKTATKQGGQLKFFNLTGRLYKLLTITKLLTVFDTFESEEKAIASFS